MGILDIKIFESINEQKDVVFFCMFEQNNCVNLSIRFLVSCSGTWTTEFFAFGSSWIGNHQGSVVLNEAVLQDSFGVLVNVLLVVSDYSSTDSLSDGVDLSDSSTTADFNFDVNSGESFGATNEKWLLKFESESFWLDFVQWSSVDFDQTFAGFAESNGGSGLLSSVDLDVVTVSWGRHVLRIFYISVL